MEDYQMEMEDEKTTETNITENDNLSEDQYEITDGDIDSDDLDFDIVDFDVVDDEEDEISDKQLAGDDTESNLGDLDFDVVAKQDHDEDEGNTDFENNDELLDNLPPFDESDLKDVDLVEPLYDAADFAETTQHEDFFDKLADDDLSPNSFARKKLVIFDASKEQAELLKKYLRERTGMEVECISKKENLWRFLKIDTLDLIILETGTEGNTDAMEFMQQTKDQFPEVHFICLSGPVSLDRRLQFLNAGALDYLTRPLHLSTIAQSILVQFNRTDIYDIDNDVADFDSEPQDIPEEEPIIEETEPQPGEKSGDSPMQSEIEPKFPDEIDLIDEDF